MPTGKVNLAFTRSAGGGGMLSVAYPDDRSDGVRGELVSIDDADLTGLTDDAIDFLLIGDEGSTKKSP